MRYEDQEVHSLVRSYELATDEGRLPYFDVDELETIVTYYYDSGEFESMAKAIALGVSLHPYALTFKIKEIQLDIARKDFSRAQAKLQNLDGLSDHHVELMIARATLFIHQEKTSKALQLLEQALERAEDQEDVLQQIIDAHLSQGAYALAADAILKLCALDQELDDGTIYQLVLCFDFTQDYQRAITTFEKFLEKEPYNALLWYHKAVFSLRLGKEEQALEFFNWAVVADESFHAAYFEIGRIHEKRDRLIEAIAAYRQSISADVPSGYVHFRIGMIEQELGSHNEALRAFNAALDVEPDLEDVYLERANVLLELKEYEAAVLDYQKVWIYGNFGAEDVVDYVEALVELDRLDEAILVLKEGIAHFDDNTQLRLILAGYLFATTAYEEASDVIIDTLVLEPKAIELFYQYFPAIGEIPEITGILAEIQSGFNA